MTGGSSGSPGWGGAPGGFGGRIATEPEAIAAGLVAGDDGRLLGQPEPARALWILIKRVLTSRAGRERILGFWPAPMVKTSVSTGAAAVVESVAWVADMDKLPGQRL